MALRNRNSYHRVGLDLVINVKVASAAAISWLWSRNKLRLQSLMLGLMVISYEHTATHPMQGPERAGLVGTHACAQYISCYRSETVKQVSGPH